VPLGSGAPDAISDDRPAASRHHPRANRDEHGPVAPASRFEPRRRIGDPAHQATDFLVGHLEPGLGSDRAALEDVPEHLVVGGEEGRSFSRVEGDRALRPLRELFGGRSPGQFQEKPLLDLGRIDHASV
jgi:hypothetical protein